MEAHGWQVPDKARLVGLDERRFWLARVEIVYALPRVGALLVEAGQPRVAWDHEGVTTLPDRARVPWSESTPHAACEAWRASWLAEDGAGVCLVLLHARGLLRAVHLSRDALPQDVQRLELDG